MSDKDTTENLGSSAQLNRVCKRAGELAEMKMRELRLIHPDNIDGTFSGQQWRGVGRSRLIQDILFEEFCSDR